VLDDADTVARTARAIVVAGYTGDPEGIVAASRRSEHPELRARSISAADRLGRRSVSDRVAALSDEAPIVRRVACELEARTPRPSIRVSRALVERLSDDDALVVVVACDALGELRLSSAVSALASVAADHDDPRCREAAIAAIGAVGDPSGLDAVLRGLDDKPAVRRRSVVALAAFDGPQVEAGIEVALADHDWQVRSAAEALRAVGG
jgi:HEAT repeat protein